MVLTLGNSCIIYLLLLPSLLAPAQSRHRIHGKLKQADREPYLADVNVSTSRSRSRYKKGYKRSVDQMGEMLHKMTGKVPSFLNNYGNWCGKEGTDGEPVDNLDRCCKSHDMCYAGLKECGKTIKEKYLVRYEYLLDFPTRTIQCYKRSGDNDNNCSLEVCECDRVVVLCWMSHFHDYSVHKKAKIRVARMDDKILDSGDKNKQDSHIALGTRIKHSSKSLWERLNMG